MKNFSKRILALLMALVIASCVGLTAGAADAEETIAYGDINKDGQINAIDSLIVLRHNVQLEPIPEDMLVVADVTGDGNVNAFDALEILMVAVEQLPYFSAEVKIPAPKNNNEILALYNNAVSKAHESIPAYKLNLISKATDIKLSGTLVDPLPQNKLEAMKQDMFQEENYSNIFRQGTASARMNLPAISSITDASVFKSVSYERLSTGEYSVVLNLKDEKNPGADSVVVALFGLPDYKMMQDSLVSDMGSVAGDNEIAANIKVGDMYYKNGYISFVLDPRTGELVSLDMSVDMSVSSKTSIAVVLTLNMDATMRTQMKYTNFIY